MSSGRMLGEKNQEEKALWTLWMSTASTSVDCLSIELTLRSDASKCSKSKLYIFFRSFLLHKFNSPNRQKYIETHNVTSTAWAPRFDRNVQEVKNIG